MRIKFVIALTAFAFGFGVAGSLPAMAQQDGVGPNAVGEQAYMSLCATCHGEHALGDGPMTALLINDIPDLSQLSARNDGEFPMLEVLHIVDGRTGLRGHGGPMPIYGDLFQTNAGPMGTETYIRGRVLSVVYYLESIQK